MQLDLELWASLTLEFTEMEDTFYEFFLEMFWTSFRHMNQLANPNTVSRLAERSRNSDAALVDF